MVQTLTGLFPPQRRRYEGVFPLLLLRVLRRLFFASINSVSIRLIPYALNLMANLCIFHVFRAGVVTVGWTVHLMAPSGLILSRESENAK